MVTSPVQPELAGVILVLSSRRSFEKFVNRVPSRLESVFRFVRPREMARIDSLLSRCRLLISKSYLPPLHQRAIFAARRLGVPTLLLIDGPLEWSNTHNNPNLKRYLGPGAGPLHDPIIHDIVAGIGSEQVRWIESRNTGRGIEFMTYANHRMTATEQMRAEAKRGDPVDGDPRNEELDFLVTTARTPYFDEREKADLIQALSDVSRSLVDGGYQFRLRIFDESLSKA
ncbi:MAG: hypothetical protein VCB25_09240, partial [Myxococcota bacterium]